MKETFYFRHDYNARNDERILELRARYGHEGYAIFWYLVESMAESTDGYLNRGAIAGLAIGLGVEKEKLTGLINLCIKLGLFGREKDKFFSHRILRHKEERKLYAEAGRRGGLAKASQKSSPPTSLANTPPPSKERRGEERKEDSGPLRGEIERQLKRQAIENPAAYLDKLLGAVAQDWPAVKKAWGEWQRGCGIETPSEFYSRCIHWHNSANTKLRLPPTLTS